MEKQQGCTRDFFFLSLACTQVKKIQRETKVKLEEEEAKTYSVLFRVLSALRMTLHLFWAPSLFSS